MLATNPCDGTDANADGQVSRAEAEHYVNEPAKIEAAHESAQLERG